LSLLLLSRPRARATSPAMFAATFRALLNCSILVAILILLSGPRPDPRTSGGSPARMRAASGPGRVRTVIAHHTSGRKRNLHGVQLSRRDRPAQAVTLMP